MDAATNKWKFRPPPRGVVRENLKVCKARTGTGEECCELGDHCDEAHSQEELQEWLVRWDQQHRSTKPSPRILLDKSKDFILVGAMTRRKLTQRKSLMSFLTTRGNLTL